MGREELIQKIQEATVVLRALQKTYYSKHFYEFNRDVLRWPDIYEPLHRRVCNFIQDNIDNRKLLLLLPRGTFKSSIVTVGYTLWMICRNPNERILIANATIPMAQSFLKQIKDHLTKNSKLKEIFGDFSENAETWKGDSITISGEGELSYRGKEPTVSVYGIGSNLVGSHFSFAILDDMVNRDNIGTKDQMDKVITFYKDILDLVDPVGGKKHLIVIGTTWHQNDLYAWIEDPTNAVNVDFEVMKMPAYTGEWGKGELLFPTRLGWDQLDELKRGQDAPHFSAQYLLDPVPLEDATFKNFRYYDETDLRNFQLNTFMAVDPAISQKKEADYSAMVCVGVDKDNNWYIRDLWKGKVDPKKLIDQIFYWDQMYKPIQIGLEAISFQRMLQFAINDEMKKRNRFIPLIDLKHQDNSKEDRIRGLQPRYEIGSIFHLKSNKFNGYLEDELLHFPRAQHDDLSDALSFILEIAYPPRERNKRQKTKYGIYPA